MAPGGLDLEKHRWARKSKRRSRVRKNSIPRQCYQAVRSAEEDDYSHLFRGNEEWTDSFEDIPELDDNLVSSYNEIDTNGTDCEFTKSDSYLVINLSSLRSKKVRGKWVRRFTEELEQVSDMAKQLVDQGTQSASNSSMSLHDLFGVDEVGDRDEHIVQDFSEVALVREQDQLVVYASGRCGHKPSKKLKKVPKTSSETDPLVNKKQVQSFRRVEKPALATGVSQSDDFVVQAFKGCKNVLGQLMKHEFAWVFNAPVDTEGFNLYDYHSIIKLPMDLGTVKDRLTTNWYETPLEFAEDVRLTFRNAMTYNPKGHDVHLMAEKLLEIFEERWLVIEEKYYHDLKSSVNSDEDLVTQASKRISHPSTSTPFTESIGAFESCYSESPANSASPGQEMVLEMLDAQTTAPSIGTSSGLESRPGETHFSNASQDQEIALEMLEGHSTTPSTRIMDALESISNGIPGESANPVLEVAPEMPEVLRDMSYEEKQKIITCIQELPPLKLGGVVDIIKKRNSAHFQNEDEVELDINCLDVQTVWELQSYVLECYTDL